jgi:hypothetical protein
MEIQSERACNQLFSYKQRFADEAHSPSPYTPSMAQPSVRRASGFVLAGYTDKCRNQSKKALPLLEREM